MQQYKGQERTIAESALSLLAKYKVNNARPDRIDLLSGVKDSQGKVLLGSIEEVRFLERDGYLSISESRGFNDKPHYEFKITEDGEHWLSIASNGGFSKQLVRDQVLKKLYEKEEEVNWSELVQCLRDGDEAALAIVSRTQVLKAVEYFHQKELVSLKTLPGDGGIIDFYTKISALGIDYVEGNRPVDAGGFSINISQVSNSNLALNSAQARQSIGNSKADDLLPRMRQEISELLSAVRDLELTVKSTTFEAYLSAALSAIEESPPDPGFAAKSASKALSVREVADAIESTRDVTSHGVRAWDAMKSLVVTIQNFLD